MATIFSAVHPRPTLSQGNSFVLILLEAEWTAVLPNQTEEIDLFKNSKDPTGNRTRSLRFCGAVPQPTAPQPFRIARQTSVEGWD